jgi:hypothetical protein
MSKDGSDSLDALRVVAPFLNANRFGHTVKQLARRKVGALLQLGPRQRGERHSVGIRKDVGDAKLATQMGRCAVRSW